MRPSVHPLASAALPASLGVMAAGLAVLTWWVAPEARVVPAVLGGFAVVWLTVGTYRLVDVVENAARRIVERD